LTSSSRRSFGTSAGSAPSVPVEIPALAITRSGAPKLRMKSCAAADSAASSVTSSEYEMVFRENDLASTRRREISPRITSSSAA
jgi:hypothetical protein